MVRVLLMLGMLAIFHENNHHDNKDRLNKNISLKFMTCRLHLVLIYTTLIYICVTLWIYHTSILFIINKYLFINALCN